MKLIVFLTHYVLLLLHCTSMACLIVLINFHFDADDTNVFYACVKNVEQMMNEEIEQIFRHIVSQTRA